MKEVEKNRIADKGNVSQVSNFSFIQEDLVVELSLVVIFKERLQA
jgi:hypothetical protein